MAVAMTLARAGFRRRRGLVGLSLALVLGVGAALAALEAARRTERAYPSYLRRAEVGELVVNPSLTTGRAAEIIVSTPGVRSYATHSSLLATPDQGDPRSQGEVENGGIPIQLLVSSDGRYVEQDRPVVHAGRMIRGGAEAFLGVETARALDLGVGDTLPLAFWAPSYVIPGLAEPSDVVEPIGRRRAVVVGIGVFADEVLTDELYPRQRILVTPDVASEFDCTLGTPAADDPRSLDQLSGILIPPGCALTYRYYSLRVDGDDAGARAVAETLAARFAEENERLPAAMRAGDFGYIVIPQFTAEVRRGLARSLQPAVRSLQLFGAAAGAATLVVVLLGAFRIARRYERDARTWLHLGATRWQRAAGISIPLAAAGAAGLAGSLVAGWLGSGIGPVASARSVEPAGRLGLSTPVVLAVLGATVLILAAGFALAAAGATRRRVEAAPLRPTWPSKALSRMGNPSLTIGLRAALFSSGAKALLVASVAAITAVLATTVFITSLTSFVGDSERFGWPYDAGVIVGFGYGGADDAAIAATLDRPDVQAWGVAAMAVDSTINGEPVPFLAGRRQFDDLPLPVIEGDLPVDDDEIALGTLTADRLGLDVGDTAQVMTPYGERQATVRGLVVLPSVGPFEADRVSLGTGALLSERFFETVLRDAEREAGLEPGALSDGSSSFVVIDLHEGLDPVEFLTGITAELASWDVNGFQPFVYPDPVRPAPVADVAAMRAVPLALVGVFALAMAIGLGVGIAAATRARRRELAVLRALGCVGRQLRASVRWHALGMVAIGIVVGLPLGLALGRGSYQAFAYGLGFFPEPVVSPWWTLVIVVAAVAMSLLASAGPAHHGARTATAEVLRHE